MNEDKEDNPFVDVYISNWEQQCIDQLNSEQDLEGVLNVEKDLVNHNIWCSFQNTATAIAQLYKDRVQSATSLWVPFQAAAGTVTTLYKDCGEGIKKVSDVGLQCGYQRRNKELLQWARKRRRNIRREDLLAYLAGKAPPMRVSSQNHRNSSRVRISSMGHQDHHSVDDINSLNSDDNLRMFGEALAISKYDTGIPRHRQRSGELTNFFTSEYSRHCIKRPASTSPTLDVNMDSPTHKRSRLA